MPAAIRYEPNPQSLAARELDDQYVSEATARGKSLTRNWRYYDGNLPKPLKVEQDDYDDNIIMPKVDQVADKLVAMLYGDGIDWQVGAADAEGADDDVEALWTANTGEQLLSSIGLSGVMAGHVFVRLQQRQGDWPRIVNLNPAHVGKFWDAMDVDRTLWYRLQYVAGTMGKRIDYVRGVPDGEEWNHDADGWTERVLTYDRSLWNLAESNPWPWEWSPIIDWQNNTRPFAAYGLDDVTRVADLNDAVNFVASNYNRILKHHASPKTIGLGFTTDELMGTRVGGLFTVNKPAGEANIYNLEMQSDLASSREFLALLMRELWQSVRLIDPQTVRDTVGALTNFGLRVLYQDALAKLQAKRLVYGDGLVEVTKRALDMAGRATEDVITIRWPDVLPEDVETVSKSLLAELEAGIVDKQTYREIRGYDHEQIEERLADERAGETSLGEQLLTTFARGGDFGRQAEQGNQSRQANQGQQAQVRRAI